MQACNILERFTVNKTQIWKKGHKQMSKEKKYDNKKSSTEDKWLTVFYG